MDARDETIRYAEQHAASIFPGMPPETHGRLGELVLRSLRSAATGRTLASWLLDHFGMLNLDWNLVAASIVGECTLQGFVASRPPGSNVRWLAAADGCGRCRALDGKVFQVVPADAADRDWFRQVWRGKSRFGGGLPPGDWPSAGLQHYGCRCSWVVAPGGEPPPGVDAAFFQRMQEILRT
jgi:hypothetical protein